MEEIHARGENISRRSLSSTGLKQRKSILQALQSANTYQAPVWCQALVIGRVGGGVGGWMGVGGVGGWMDGWMDEQESHGPYPVGVLTVVVQTRYVFQGAGLGNKQDKCCARDGPGVRAQKEGGRNFPLPPPGSLIYAFTVSASHMTLTPNLHFQPQPVLEL